VGGSYMVVYQALQTPAAPEIGGSYLVVYQALQTPAAPKLGMSYLVVWSYEPWSGPSPSPPAFIVAGASYIVVFIHFAGMV